MITLLGVGHVFPIKEAIRYLILIRKPDSVCVELDSIRFQALESGALHDDSAPFLIKRLQKIYEKAATSQGASIGEEMLSGIETAKEIGVPYHLIDLEAGAMLDSLIDSLTVGQKIKIAGQVLTASVLPNNIIEEGLKKVQEDPDSAMIEFEKQYPSLKKTIVDQRDSFMASKIRELGLTYMNMICIVGEGHINGIVNAISDLSLEVIHLKEIIKVAKDLKDGKIAHPKVSIGNHRTSNISNMDFGYTFNLMFDEDTN